MIRFRWDDKKKEVNRRKHGIRFERATEVFRDQFRIEEPNHFENEERWQIIGMTTSHVLLFVVFMSIYEGNIEFIRIISARCASDKERKRYDNRKLF